MCVDTDGGINGVGIVFNRYILLASIDASLLTDALVLVNALKLTDASASMNEFNPTNEFASRNAFNLTNAFASRNASLALVDTSG
jgi:hypothetical protein